MNHIKPTPALSAHEFQVLSTELQSRCSRAERMRREAEAKVFVQAMNMPKNIIPLKVEKHKLLNILKAWNNAIAREWFLGRK